MKKCLDETAGCNFSVAGEEVGEEDVMRKLSEQLAGMERDPRMQVSPRSHELFKILGSRCWKLIICVRER